MTDRPTHAIVTTRADLAPEPGRIPRYRIARIIAFDGNTPVAGIFQRDHDGGVLVFPSVDYARQCAVAAPRGHIPHILADEILCTTWHSLAGFPAIVGLARPSSRDVPA